MDGIRHYSRADARSSDPIHTVPDQGEARRDARIRVFRGEDPLVVIQLLRDAGVPDAGTRVERYRIERDACIRQRARADLAVCSLLLLAVIGMQEWIRPYGAPPRIALWLVAGGMGLKFVIKSSLMLLKAGHVPGDYSRLMPPDPELDPRTSWMERVMTVGFSPLAGYGLLFLMLAAVIGWAVWVMYF